MNAQDHAKLTKSESEVIRRISESPRGLYGFTRGAHGKRLINAVLKLERAGVIKVTRETHSGWEHRRRVNVTDLNCALA